MKNAVGGMCTHARLGMSLPYFVLRAVRSATNQVTIDGSTQFGMSSEPAGAWNSAPPWESKKQRIAIGMPLSFCSCGKSGR